MNIFVLNAGSSSLKYQLINPINKEILAMGICEKIGIDGILKHKFDNNKTLKINSPMPTHKEAILLILEILTNSKGKGINFMDNIGGIGHRVVHGGEDFTSSVKVTNKVLDSMKKLTSLAPLHSKANIMGIEICKKLMPQKINVAVFDTTFHQTMPDYAYMYPLPYEQYKKYKIRKYGFHGTSHYFVSNEAIKLLKQKPNSKIIVCHLGNGSSICAVLNGKSIDTSMGLTPLQGLMMGTRAGDIGIDVVSFVMKKEQLTIDEVLDIMNKKSGILGVSGKSSDLRDVIGAMENGDDRCKLALEMFSYSIKKYIGSYIAALNGIDALCFTGGIGENSPLVRQMVCSGLDNMGLIIDPIKNRQKEPKQRDIATNNSSARIFIIPTKEEYVIAKDTYEVITKTKI